jgi:choline dehydrogenase-like flavoprotein
MRAFVMPDLTLPSSERSVIAALVQTFAPEESDAKSVAGAVETAFGLLEPRKCEQLRGLLRMLEGRILGALLIGRFAPFSTLAHADRERLLLAMADSGIAQMRSGYQALKRLCCFAAYAAVDAANRNPLWPIIGYPGPRADRESGAVGPLPSNALPVVAIDSVKSADAIVIGSGAGGGVAAALLARAGRQVVVLEAGPNPDPQHLSQLESEAMASLYLDHATAATDDVSMVLLAGACVGGGTTINWCTSLRISEKVAAQWGDASGGVDFASELKPHYDAVIRRLDIAPSDRHNRNNAALLRGCQALGWHAAANPKNAVDCGDGCGYCGFGCAYGCKRSTLATYLRDAVGAGARVVANARVERVLIQDSVVRGVEAVVDGKRAQISAPLVVTAAGSLRSPGVLARGGVASAHLGRHLHVHPVSAIFAGFDEPIETWRGSMQTVFSDQFSDLDDGYGATMEVVPSHPGLSASAIAWRGRSQHFDLLRNARNAAAFISLTRDRGEGRVKLTNDDVEYRLDPYDARHLLAGLRGTVEVAFAAGAERVITLHTKPLELRRQDASPARRKAFGEEIARASLAPNRLALFSAHQMGTCRMHRDPTQGVVDEFGAVHGVRGLLVSDGSVFPLASGVNPMLTIMALAHRSISHHVSAAR